jgi:hypothetical protein
MTDFIDDREEALRAVRVFRRAMENNGIDREHAMAAMILMSLEWKLDNVKPKGVSTAKPNIPTVPSPDSEDA